MTYSSLKRDYKVDGGRALRRKFTFSEIVLNVGGSFKEKKIPEKLFSSKK